MKSTRKLINFSLVAPIALALTACGGDTGGLEGDAIAAIPAPDGSSWTEVVNKSEDGLGYIVGNPDAPIKLVEYASHTCGACAYFSQSGKPSLKDDYIAKGIVSFEQREIFLNPFDVVIATLAQCGPDERFQPLSDDVWQNNAQLLQSMQANPQALQAANQLTGGDKNVAMGAATGLIDFFAARGLSADQARTCLADEAAVTAMIEGNGAKAKEMNILGTPTFFLNGNEIEAKQWPDVEAALKAAGARPTE